MDTCLTSVFTGRLQATWTSAVYSFFKSDVYVAYDRDGRKYQFFPCAAKPCKAKEGGIRRYQDRKDRSSTGNLKKHAVKCFGQAAVDEMLQGQEQLKAKNGSIFAVFAKVGQRVTKATNRNHNRFELRYDISLLH